MGSLGTVSAYSLFQNLCFPLSNGTPCINWTGTNYEWTNITVSGDGNNYPTVLSVNQTFGNYTIQLNRSGLSTLQAHFSVNSSGGSGSGTVTSITEGIGINLTPDTITTTGSVAIANLATCNPSTQYSVWNGSHWRCQADSSGGSGTVTSVGSGSGLTGGPITTTGTLSINATTCTTGNYTQWNGTAFNCSPDQNTGTGGGISGVTVTNPDTFLNLTTNGTNIAGNINFTSFDARYILNTVYNAFVAAIYTNVTTLQTFDATIYTNVTTAQGTLATRAGIGNCVGSNSTHVNVTMNTTTTGVQCVAVALNPGAGGGGTVSSVSLTTNGSSSITITGSPVTTTGTFNIQVRNASTSQDGLLRSTDFTTFNNKGFGNITAGAGSTIGNVAFWNNGTMLNGTTNLYWDAANNRLGIGTSSPAYQFVADGGTAAATSLYTTSGGQYQIQFNVGGSNAWEGGVFNAGRFRGTRGAPAVLNDGDDIFTLNGASYDGTGAYNDGSNYAGTANIAMEADGNNVAGTSYPTRISFSTTNSGSTGNTEKVRITAAGRMGIGTAATSTSYLLNVAGQVNATGYTTNGTDYSEFVQKVSLKENITTGDVVGIFEGGQASKTTTTAIDYAVVSGENIGILAGQGTAYKAVLVNKTVEVTRLINNTEVTTREVVQDYAIIPITDYTGLNSVPIAFTGQVRVKVRGVVTAGDWLVPSGLNDGVAIPISFKELSTLATMRNTIDAKLGVAWESNINPGTKMVLVRVGMR